MILSEGVVSIDELRDAIIKSYPGIEQQLKEVFFRHDIAGDGALPYGVVEPLLRHFFYQCGLDDYIPAIIDSEGKLRHTDLAPYLVDTSLKDVMNLDENYLISCQEMITMAVVWLKIISDHYQKEEAEVVTPRCDMGTVMCCQGTRYVSTNQEGNDQINQLVQNGSLTENQAEMFEGESQYTEHINTENEEEEIRQKNVENYIQTLVQETTMKRKDGVKCYVYPANATVNGSCVSAGAALPQRRPPRPKDKKPAPGCC